jgi:phage terminase large subunit-like protein
MSLPPAFRERLLKLWGLFSHPHQRPPEFAQGGGPWSNWLILGGRGAGKTRAGAEWVRGHRPLR